MEQYIRPLEYVGIVNRVLESTIPNQMVLYAAKKIHGKVVEIQINMDNYETHTITFSWMIKNRRPDLDENDHSFFRKMWRLVFGIIS